MAYVKRSKRGIEPTSSLSEEDLKAEEQRIVKELGKLQRMAKDKDEKQDFDKLFTKLDASHQQKLKKGGKDANFEAFLADHIKKTQKQIRQLKTEIETRQSESFVTLAQAGARPKRERNVALIVSTRELYRIVSALQMQERSLSVVNPGERPSINEVDADVAKGKLSAYLLRCALEAGIGWATPLAPTHYEDHREPASI